MEHKYKSLQIKVGEFDLHGWSLQSSIPSRLICVLSLVCVFMSGFSGSGTIPLAVIAYFLLCFTSHFSSENIFFINFMMKDLFEYCFLTYIFFNRLLLFIFNSVTKFKIIKKIKKIYQKMYHMIYLFFNCCNKGDRNIAGDVFFFKT